MTEYNNSAIAIRNFADTLIFQTTDNLVLSNKVVIPTGYVNATQMLQDDEHYLFTGDLAFIAFSLKALNLDEQENIIYYPEGDTYYVSKIIASILLIQKYGLNEEDVEYLGCYLNIDFDVLEAVLHTLWECSYITQLHNYLRMNNIMYGFSLQSRNFNKNSTIFDVFKPFPKPQQSARNCLINLMEVPHYSCQDRTGHFYIFINKEKSKIKIGFTSNSLPTRLKQVSHASGEFLSIFYSKENVDMKSELEFHKNFSHHPSRLPGEWYKFNQTIINEAKTI